MNDKPIAYILAFAGMAACCVGVPLLVGFLLGAGVFAWLADNSLAVIAPVLIAAAVALLVYRDRKRRRQPGAEPRRVAGRPASDDA